MRYSIAALIGTLVLLPSSLTSQLVHRVDVGGHELQAVVWGSGSPTVVFESDIGTALEIWNSVQALVSEFATTVAYSRAGLGDSDMATTNRSPSVVTEELRTLLRGLGQQPPYVLVGHSFGGLLSRAFFYEHPDEVAGLVLVQGSDERLLKELMAVDPSWTPKPAVWDDEARLAEVEMLRRVQDTGSLANSRPLASIPVYILTRGRPSRGSASEALIVRVARDLHAELFSGVTNGAHIVVDEPHHLLHIVAPELVAQSIRQVVDAVRSSSNE
jgi:pimeloyl-ACP methyl ester carboxylesterase